MLLREKIFEVVRQQPPIRRVREVVYVNAYKRCVFIRGAFGRCRVQNTCTILFLTSRDVCLLPAIFDKIEATALDNEDQDLLLEVWLCRMIMEPAPVEVRTRILAGMNTLPAYHGLTLGLGAEPAAFLQRLQVIYGSDCRLPDGPLQDPMNRASYYLDHTNLVQCMLELVIKRQDRGICLLQRYSHL